MRNNESLAVSYIDFHELIYEVFGVWCRDNDSYCVYNSNDEIWEKTISVAPNIWVMRDIINEICIEKDVKLINYNGVMSTVKEVCDLLSDFLDLEKIIYVGADNYLKNDCQLFLCDEKSELVLLPGRGDEIYDR